MLNEFRTQQIRWDKATRKIYDTVQANASDSNGRKLHVQITNDGMVEDLTGATLSLYWESRDGKNKGLDALKAVDVSKGEFELFYTTGMLSNVGRLNAALVLVDSTGKTASDWFTISNIRGIDEDAVESSNEFTALTEALVKVNDLEENYAPRLNEVTAQLAETVENVNDRFGILSKELEDEIGSFVNNGIRQRITNRIKDENITLTLLVAFEIERDTNVNRVKGYVGVRDAGKLMEVGIYDSKYNRVSTTEPREIPEVGEYEFSLPHTILIRGTYYYAITTNSDVAEFGINPYFGGATTSQTLPLPSTLSDVTPVEKAPYAMLLGYDLPKVEVEDFEMTHIRVHGNDGSILWGRNTETGKICRSTTQGETWSDMMVEPVLSGETVFEMVITDGRIYIMTNMLNIYRSSGLTSSATWEDVSCPISPGLRHSQALGRPYGMIKFGGYIYIGEYSNTSSGEFEPDGPRILKYNIQSGEWSLSKEFIGARHIHSFATQGTTALYVSIGDAGYDHIGMHRLTTSGINDDSEDSWTKWTSAEGPNSNHYPVDFLVGGSAFGGAPPGIYMTSDRPGYHLLYSKFTGTVGGFNVNPQLFNKPESSSGETVRSLIADDDGNLYYWTAETDNHAIYVTPPPYTQSYKLKDLTENPSLVLLRSFSSGDNIFMFNQRFKKVDFNS